jgi:hypothetical protein
MQTTRNVLIHCGFKWRTTCYVVQDNGAMFPCHRIGDHLWDKRGDLYNLAGDKVLGDKKQYVGRPLYVLPDIQVRLMRALRNSPHRPRARFTSHERISLQALVDKQLVMRWPGDTYDLTEIGKINLLLQHH